MGAFARKKINRRFYMVYTWSYLDEWINAALNSVDRDYSAKWRRDDERGGWGLSFVLPGIKKEDVDVTSGHGWARVKHPNASLRISLPKDSDHEAIEAKLDLGIFELFAPDVKASGTRTIKVQ